jgi:hypothetical protein
MALTIKDDKFTKVYLIIWGALLFVAFVALLFYQFGFRLADGFEPVRVGSIELLSNEDGLQIILDNRDKRAPLEGGAYYIREISPGLHSLLVFKDGFWPWVKTFYVKSNSVESVFAFLFPVNGLETELVDRASAEYAAALLSIKGNVIPKVKPDSLLPEDLKDGASYMAWLSLNVQDLKVSADGSTALFVQDNIIYAVWISDTEPAPHYFCEEDQCRLKLPVTALAGEIKNLDFYKGRRDVLLFASGSVIYAIEVNPIGNQNFQPVYKGTDPYFYESPDGVIYVKDGDFVFKADL